MTILETLQRTLRPGTTTSYKCCLCAARFDRHPLNCPSCGCTAIEPD